MVIALLVAGIGSLLVGLLAIVFGIPVKEFSFGNTLIVVGTVAACTGLVMLGFWMVVRALNDIALRLGPGVPVRSRAGATPTAAGAPNDDFLFGRDQPAAEGAEPSAPAFPPPWQDEAASRDRGRIDAPPAPEPAEAAPVKPRRNLLFSTSSRKERERAQARAADPSAVELQAAPASASSASEPAEAPPATFDDAWPKSARMADMPPRRGGRAPPTFNETSAAATAADRYSPAARNEDQPPVTVLKSGVVDGMAYSLYSDGSIEAQMPEGMMRFASIDELRAHLDHRP